VLAVEVEHLFAGDVGAGRRGQGPESAWSSSCGKGRRGRHPDAWPSPADGDLERRQGARKPSFLGVHVQEAELLRTGPPLRGGRRGGSYLIERDQEPASDARGVGPLRRRARGVGLLEGDGSWPTVTNWQVDLRGQSLRDPPERANPGGERVPEGGREGGQRLVKRARLCRLLRSHASGMLSDPLNLDGRSLRERVFPTRDMERR